jgi:hypothetical protein
LFHPPLEATLSNFVDFPPNHGGPTRLTVGAANIQTGEMRYFDSRVTKLTGRHVPRERCRRRFRPCASTAISTWLANTLAAETFAMQFFRAGSRHDCYRAGRAGGRAVKA